MRRTDDAPLGDEEIGALLALDATLAGEPVDPEFAELAEIALLLRQERPQPDQRFASELDLRVQRRFAPAWGSEGAGGSGRRRRWWLWGPGMGVAAALGVAVVLLVGGSNRGSLSNRLSLSSSSSASSAASSASPPSAKSAQPSVGTGQLLTPVPSPPGATATGGHRQVVQSAQLQLMAEPTQIDSVAQQVFGVVAAEKGIVNSSNVTATGDANGNANFELSVPSGNLQETMSALSQLRGSRVLSRTDSSADITGQVGGAGIRLAEARALRHSLLEHLGAAVTQQRIDSLETQLRDADASIASDLSTLRGLQRQVQYSRISLAIQAGSTAVTPGGAGGGGFTLHRALHDAGRVLVVVAGVALIALAVLLPLGLVAALAAWLGLSVRRRRREHALDLV